MLPTVALFRPSAVITYLEGSCPVTYNILEFYYINEAIVDSDLASY